MLKGRTILLVSLTASMLISASACTGTPSKSASESSTVISEIESSEMESSKIESSEIEVSGIESSETESKETSSKEASSAPGAAKLGESVQNSNFKITLTSAEMLNSVTVGEGDLAFENKPDEGKKYLVLFFEAENISDEDQYINYFYYDSYLDDTAIDTEVLLADFDDYDIFTGDIAPGKKLKGYVAYQVDTDWKKLEFTYNDRTTSEKYNFIVTSEDFGYSCEL